jgi:hypothetical protein
MVIDCIILYLLVSKKIAKFSFSTTQLIYAISISIAFLAVAFTPNSLTQKLVVCGTGLTGFILIAWYLVLSNDDKLLFTNLIYRRCTVSSS